MTAGYYTPMERAAILEAWEDLFYLAEGSNWSAPFRLREALQHEARERGLANAQALMVREALQGMTGPYSAAELFTNSPGLATAHMFGAWTMTQVGRVATLAEEFKTRAALANTAHETAQARHMTAWTKEGDA